MTFDDLVADSTVTCGACPYQVEGQLTDGQAFYFRYRWGCASLGIGADVDAAVSDSFKRFLSIGDPMDGVLDNDQFREIFMVLYALDVES